MQPVRVRTAGGGRPALATGVFLLVASLVLLVAPPVPSGARSTSPTSRSVVDVLVQGDGAAAAVVAAGGRSLAALPIVGGLLAQVPAARAGELSNDPGVRSVTDADRPLTIRAAAPTPGGGDSPSQPSSGSASGAGVAVGVLDTGIAGGGDLAGRVMASADLSGEWSFTDSYGHGTFMAGLIAGSGQGGGPAGVAPGASLVDLKVAGADGATTLGQVLAGLQLADAARERFNLRVLNISLGASADDPATAPLTEAVERLWADGITVVAAAGNDGGGVDAPGLDPYVVTVGSVDTTGPGARCLAGAAAGPTSPAGTSRAWSPRVSAWSACAPPGRPSTWPTRRPGWATATSAGRAPRCRPRWWPGPRPGVAAAHPGWGPDRIKAALTGTADHLAQAGAGAGALDLEAALGLAAVPAANADLFPLRTVGRAATPTPPGPVAGLDWRADGADGLRWAPAGGLPGPTPGADDTEAWAARRWAATGLEPAGWAALQWSWGGLRAAALEPTTWGTTPAVPQTPPAGSGGAVDWVARSWAARSWAERAWGPGDLAARSWAARSWAELAWEARSWAARSWARPRR